MLRAMKRARNKRVLVSRGSAKEEEHSEEPKKVDPLVAYSEHTVSSFQESVVQSHRLMSADIRWVRNYAISHPQLQEHHPALVEKLTKIDDSSFKILGEAKSVDRRLQTQLQKTKKAAAAKAQGMLPRSTHLKNSARQEAGKLKASSLAMYHQDFKAARQALKDEGYTGSLKLKKGMPMHTKMLELKEKRVSGLVASGGGGSQAPALGEGS